MNIDTNIDNYNLDDMTTLFKISNNLTEENVVQMIHTIKQINEATHLDPDIYSLFKKVFIILLSIHKYRNYLKIKNGMYQRNISDDNKLIAFIKSIPNYENTNDVSLLLNQLFIAEEAPAGQAPAGQAPGHAQATVEVHRPLVTDNTVKNILNTFENKIVSGNINSIQRITKLVNVHIDSCFREKYYNSNPCNFVYILPKQFKNVVSMKLASIEIPNSWYLFSHLKKNNTFIIEIKVCNECSVNTIIIPDGNYNSDTLVSFLNMKYFNQSKTELPLKYLTISINEFNNKTQFEIIEGAPEDLVFSLHFTSEKTENMIETCGWILGFRLARYLAIEDFIFSEGLFDAGGDRYIYFCVNDYQYNYNETNVICFDKSSIEEHTLAKISLMNGKFSLIIDENDSNPLIKIRQYNGPVNLNKFEIKILDKYGNIIDLNFMDFSFSLELEILYERNNII
jgi:hypothetical protein